jgi:hypothetical protein
MGGLPINGSGKPVSDISDREVSRRSRLSSLSSAVACAALASASRSALVGTLRYNASYYSETDLTLAV